MAEQMLHGLDSKKRLLGFFAAKGHNNLVLRVVDVMGMPLENQRRLFAMLTGATLAGQTQAELKSAMLTLTTEGFLVIPFAELLAPMELEHVEQLQVLLHQYKEVRQTKGWPVDKQMCPKCAGGGCDDCERGSIYVYLEMSAGEKELAK